MKFRKLLQFAMERLMFAPMFQGVSLYTLARFEGKNHDDAVKNLMRLYIPVLTANWKYLSLFTLINFTVVPPMVNLSIISEAAYIRINVSLPFSCGYCLQTLSDSAGSYSWPRKGASSVARVHPQSLLKISILYIHYNYFITPPAASHIKIKRV